VTANTSIQATGLSPRILVLREGRAGDDRQLVNLAEALGRPYEVVPFHVTIARVIRDRIQDALNISGPMPDGQTWGPPWPDLVLATGGRAVSAATRLRRMSSGRTKIVFVGRPWASLNQFDLVITTPQYRLPDAPNVVQNLLPLNRVPDDRLAEGRVRVADRIANLPTPRIAVLLGGDNTSHRLDAETARKIARRASARARTLGGSLMVTSSPRTAGEAMDAFTDALDAPATVYRWQPDDPVNPLTGYLGTADRIIVTGESASMLAEACRTGKPVEVVGLPKRARARLLTRPFGGRLAGLGRALAPMARALARAGVIVPPRDLDRLHAALYRHAVPADADGSAICLDGDGDLRRAVAGIDALLARQGGTAYKATAAYSGDVAVQPAHNEQSG
jgi:mitochondrial fission protein ELM1